MEISKKNTFGTFAHLGEKSRREQHDQLKYLSQSVALEEATHPQIVKATMVLISVAVLGFIAWSAFAKINEVARANGEIIPKDFVQNVEQYDGGIVREILVKEGDTVEKGQVLLKLDGTGATQDLAEVNAKEIALEKEEDRLRAIISYAEMKSKDGKFEGTDAQKAIYQSMIDAFEGEKNVIKTQIDQKNSAISVLRSQAGTLSRNVALSQQTFSTYEQLYQQNLLSKVKYVQVQKDLNDYQGELARINSEISEAQHAIAEYKSRLASLEASHIDTARQSLDKITGEIAQNSETLKKLQDKVDRLDIKAPVRGLVKGLAINTIGGVVKPGETLMEIVPLDQNLVVETKIEPKFIGQLKIGQPVQVKISSYDFARYGAVDGKLDFISAITFKRH